MIDFKILAIGDPHFKTSNIPDTNEFIKKIKNLAIVEKPNIIVILGDILHEHERLNTLPLNKSYEFIQEMSSITTTYILVGNHDLINNQQYLTENHWMNGLKEWKNVFIADKVIEYELENGEFFLFCPYVPNGKFKDALNTYESKKWTSAKLIFAHQEFKGCKMGAIESIDGDEWGKEYPYVISGHIHSNQKLDNVYYPGSAMQNAFGDPNNIIPIIEFNDSDEEFNVREVDLELRKKKLVYMNLDDVDSYQLKETEDDIKLTLTGNYDEFKTFRKSQKYKELQEAGIKIVHKNKKIKNDDENSLDVQIDPNNVDTDSSFVELVYSMVFAEKNNVMTSDYNYLFRGGAKNEELLVL